MKKILWLLAISQLASAQEHPGAGEATSASVTTDRFRVQATFNEQFHPSVRGKTMDMKERQPVHRLDAGDLAWLKESVGVDVDLKPGEIAFANFYCWGQDWVVKVPKDFAAQGFIQQEHYTGGALKGLLEFGRFDGHAQMRFTSKIGQELTLYPQRVGQAKPSREKLANVVFSGEAVRAEKAAFNPLDGLAKKYSMTLRAVCDEDKYRGMWEELKHNTPQFQMHPDGVKGSTENEMLQKLARASIDRGEQYYQDYRNRKYELYNTIGKDGHSCITVQKEIADAVTVYPPLQKAIIEDSKFAFLPRRIVPGFAARGLFGKANVSRAWLSPETFSNAPSYQDEYAQWGKFVQAHPELGLNRYDSRWAQREELLKGR